MNPQITEADLSRWQSLKRGTHDYEHAALHAFPLLLAEVRRLQELVTKPVCEIETPSEPN